MVAHWTFSCNYVSDSDISIVKNVMRASLKLIFIILILSGNDTQQPVFSSIGLGLR